MEAPFSYHHLHYFWVVARAGSMSRAAAQLEVSVQTVSAQVRALERSLGHALFRPAGRGLALTEAGAAALQQAEHIFALGAALPGAVQAAVQSPTVRLNVGVLDILSKWVVHRLLAPVLATPGLRLHCQVDEFDDLLGDLALHRFDVVVADRPAPMLASLRLYSHPLRSSPLAWYAAPRLAARARRDWPRMLGQLPVLLPTRHAAVRTPLERWLEGLDLKPQVVGEFEDSALIETFGAAGMGLFPAVALARADLEARYGVRCLGQLDGVNERFYAISHERRIAHPLVARLAAADAGAASPAGATRKRPGAVA